MKAYEYPVAAKTKDGSITTVPVVALGVSDILQRQLLDNKVMEYWQYNPGGRLLREEDRKNNYVVDRHLFAVPTERAYLALTGPLNGRYSRSNPEVGIESIYLRSGGIAFLGDTVLVAGDHPARLVSLFFKEIPAVGVNDEAQVSDAGCILAEVRWFRASEQVRGAERISLSEKAVSEGAEAFWEEIGIEARERVTLDRIHTRWLALDATGDVYDYDGANPPSLTRLRAMGLVERVDHAAKRRSSHIKPFRIVKQPWSL